MHAVKSSTISATIPAGRIFFGMLEEQLEEGPMYFKPLQGLPAPWVGDHAPLQGHHA